MFAGIIKLWKEKIKANIFVMWDWNWNFKWINMFEISKKKQTIILAALKRSVKSKVHETEQFYNNKNTWRWMMIDFFVIF